MFSDQIHTCNKVCIWETMITKYMLICVGDFFGPPVAYRMME